jgi:hypothetical protein
MLQSQRAAMLIVQLLIGTPKPITSLATRVFQNPKLTGANIIDESMQRQTAFTHSPLDGRMLPQDLNRMLNIEFGEPRSGIIAM